MYLGIALLIAAALIVFAALPVLAPEKEGRESKGLLPVDVTPAADLKRRRMVLYENLQDLEFEYQAKKIARDDYESLRDSYKAEAARLMVASQELQSLSPEESFIEREVAARRAQRKNRNVPDYVCPKCGFENPVPVKFCGDCGAKMAEPKASGPDVRASGKKQ